MTFESSPHREPFFIARDMMLLAAEHFLLPGISSKHVGNINGHVHFLDNMLREHKRNMIHLGTDLFKK